MVLLVIKTENRNTWMGCEWYMYFHSSDGLLTMNVPVVYIARSVMVEAGKIHYEGHWKGVGPGNRDFLGPETASSEASAIGAQKSQDF
jgi:hypothetical protein